MCCRWKIVESWPRGQVDTLWNVALCIVFRAALIFPPFSKVMSSSLTEFLCNNEKLIDAHVNNFYGNLLTKCSSLTFHLSHYKTVHCARNAMHVLSRLYLGDNFETENCWDCRHKNPTRRIIIAALQASANLQLSWAAKPASKQLMESQIISNFWVLLSSFF